MAPPSRVASIGSGDAGDVWLTGGNIHILDGSLVGSNSVWNPVTKQHGGKGGRVTLEARQLIEVKGQRAGDVSQRNFDRPQRGRCRGDHAACAPDRDRRGSGGDHGGGVRPSQPSRHSGTAGRRHHARRWRRCWPGDRARTVAGSTRARSRRGCRPHRRDRGRVDLRGGLGPDREPDGGRRGRRQRHAERAAHRREGPDLGRERASAHRVGPRTLLERRRGSVPGSTDRSAGCHRQRRLDRARHERGAGRGAAARRGDDRDQRRHPARREDRDRRDAARAPRRRQRDHGVDGWRRRAATITIDPDLVLLEHGSTITASARTRGTGADPDHGRPLLRVPGQRGQRRLERHRSSRARSRSTAPT